MGKGAIAGALHRTRGYKTAIRVGGPNAGHTVYDAEGHGYPLRQIPVAAAVDPTCELVIAAGSEVDAGVLEHEIRMLELDGHEITHRLFVDPQATLITESDYLAEQGSSFGSSGSTRKGIGAARAHRAMRTAQLVGENEHLVIGEDLLLGEVVVDTQQKLASSNADPALIEGTQGYGLGSRAGRYPHCTSGDCRAVDFLAQAGIPPQREADVWVVLRTYPIRIAGNSGPLPGEKTWEEVGVDPEFTTVTKKMRRVGEWDLGLAQRAIAVNGGSQCSVALTFYDYWHPELAGATNFGDLKDHHIHELLTLQRDLGAQIMMLGTSGSTYIPFGGSF